MLSDADLATIIGDITYQDRAGVDWSFKLGHDDREGDSRFITREGRPYVQLHFTDPRDPDFVQVGRKWRLSRWMTKSEVVWTVFAAITFAEEHELRENFRYKGARIAGPHLNVEALANIARFKENIDVRPVAEAAL